MLDSPGMPLRSIDPELSEKLLNQALSRGGEYADLYFEHSTSGAMSLEESVIKNASRAVDMGLGVRVRKGEATGYAYTEERRPEAWLSTAKTAATIADAHQSLTAATPKLYRAPDRYPVEAPSLMASGVEKRALLLRADQAARAYDPRITRVMVSFAETLKHILVVSSDGRMLRDVQPMLRINVSVVAQEGDKRQSGSSGGGGREGLAYFLRPGHRPEDHGREAARVAIAMLHAVDAPAGEFPVVLSAGDSGILLHEAVGHGLEADFNRKKTSNYSDRVGQKVASDLVTVVDDPSYPGARGSINIDDEGQTAKAHTLIQNGVLEGYLQDRQSAAFFGTESSNGRRESFRSPPMPRMTNTMLLAGPHSPEELIRSVKKGVLAKRFSGGQVNISNGDFVFSLTESYLIEDGRITAPLRGVNLIGNGPEVLSKVDMLAGDLALSDGSWTCGKDGQSVPVGVGCPSLRIQSITVGGTAL